MLLLGGAYAITKQAGTQLKSDLIHGSAGGPPPPKMEDLTPEQQFELKQRLKKPLELVPSKDPEDTAGIDDALKAAEEIVGHKWEHHDVELRIAVFGSEATEGWQKELEEKFDPDLHIMYYKGEERKAGIPDPAKSHLMV